MSDLLTPKQIVDELHRRSGNGDNHASLELGRQYEGRLRRGLVERDIPKALHWYRLAAETDMPEAKYEYAVLLLRSMHDAPSAQQSHMHLSMQAHLFAAARFGHAPSYRLMAGLTSIKVLGESEMQARRYLEKAADCGDRRSHEAINRITRGIEKTAADALTTVKKQGREFRWKAINLIAGKGHWPDKYASRPEAALIHVEKAARFGDPIAESAHNTMIQYQHVRSYDALAAAVRETQPKFLGIPVNAPK